jgi:hypothetical protein
MAPEFETFIAEYRSWLHETADDVADITEGELIGVYDTGHDIEGWDDFRALLRRERSFEKKFDRYRALIQSLKLPQEHING